MSVTTLLNIEGTTKERDYSVDEYHLILSQTRRLLNKVEKYLTMEYTEENEKYHKKLREDVLKIQRSIHKLASDYQKKLWFR